MALLVVVGCKGFNSVDPDAAGPAAKNYWQLLQANDVSKAMEMYDGSVWSTDPNLRSSWPEFLGGLGQKFGPVVSAELRGKKWFPGSSLVSDHRVFVCYAYDYDVKRQTLVSQERLVFCGEPHAAARDMHIYGHGLKRQDTQQSVRVGIDVQEKSL